MLPANHFEALNLILAHSCPQRTYKDKNGFDTQEFVLDLHCSTATITARLTSTFQTVTYAVLDVTIS